MSGTGNALAVRDRGRDRLEAAQQAALAIQPGQTTWDEFQNAALNQLGLKNASNADRAVFLHQCQRTGLDPFAKQIMMIERREKQGDNWVSKWTIQTGIEGWRTVRDRAERREGLRGILSRFTYYDADDNERKVWTRAEPPAVVEVTYTVVEAGGREVPYTSQLRFDEYVQTKEDKNGNRYRVAQWATKPVHMLEKCTEADVYRKAFPQDYSGVELTDAMPPAEVYDEPVQQRQRVTAAQARERGTDWQGHAEHGTRRFAEQAAAETVITATATVIPPDAAAGDGPPPATPAAARPDPAGHGAAPGTDEYRALLAAVQDHLKRIAGDDWELRLSLTARILRTPAVEALSDLTGEELAIVADTLSRSKNRAALETLLTAGEAVSGG